MSGLRSITPPRLDPAKFRDPLVTAKGERRAVVALTRLETLWFNTGSLCNLACGHCYMESGPGNDRLAYLTSAEVASYLEQAHGLPLREVGFTGGEPFMNRDLPVMLADVLERGLRALVLTNGLKPMMNHGRELAALRERHGSRMTLRVSMDHHRPERHEEMRGPGTWEPLLEGLGWLQSEGFALAIAGRARWSEPPEEARAGYAALFARLGLAVDAHDPTALILFPEMDATVDVPEITVGCWSILNLRPDAMMCATSRMVLRRKGALAAVVVPCTLLPYDTRFELGHDMTQAARAVALNHPHCAKFCVLGGGSCSVR